MTKSISNEKELYTSFCKTIRSLKMYHSSFNKFHFWKIYFYFYLSLLPFYEWIVTRQKHRSAIKRRIDSTLCSWFVPVCASLFYTELSSGQVPSSSYRIVFLSKWQAKHSKYSWILGSAYHTLSPFPQATKEHFKWCFCETSIVSFTAF